MTTRLLATLAALALGCAALAQPPTAPPPRRSLDVFLGHYRRLGLPLPPAGAELVRLKWNATDVTLSLVFRLPPAKPGEHPHLIGVDTHQWYKAGQPVKTGADALRDVEPAWVVDLLCTAAQCRAVGLNDIAETLYARGVEATTTPMPPRWRWNANPLGTFQVRADGWRLHDETDARSPLLELRHAAFGYWQTKLMDPVADRGEIFRYLREAGFLDHQIMRPLELTVAPRTSRPGSAEALIDDLVDYHRGENEGAWTSGPEPIHPGEAAYWKLAEMGFDAVPALIEHVNDPRFTRRTNDHATGGLEWPAAVDPVGQVARKLLNNIAGNWVVGGEWPVEEDDVRVWWEKARRVGEEKWLVEHALPDAREGNGFLNQRDRPNRVIYRALGAKYPRRLAEVYRRFHKRPAPEDSTLELEGRTLAQEVIASKLPRAEKLALLEEAAEHDRPVYRFAALAELAAFDPPAFRRHLLATLRWLPRDIRGKDYLMCYEASFYSLVVKTNDPTYWDALAGYARRAAPNLRLEILSRMGDESADDERRGPPVRERLRFMLGFLDDPSPLDLPLNESGWPAKGVDTSLSRVRYRQLWPGVTVRDVAALNLARELQWDELFWGEEFGPLSRLVIRAVVWQAARAELAKGK
jgi:hypothetical protein